MSKTPTPRLGKGLNALLAPKSAVSRETGTLSDPPASSASDSDNVIRELPLDAVIPNPRQPRSVFRDEALGELAESIRLKGVLQPIVVRPLPDGRYQLVAGERRWRASRRAGRETVPAVVRHLTDEQSLEIALIENLQREDLTPIERARAYRACLDELKVSPDILAGRLGESRSSIVNYLRLLQLDEEIIGMMERGELGMGQARAVAGILERERQLALARLAVRRNLSARQVEELVRKSQHDPVSRETPVERLAPKAGVDRHMLRLEESLSKSLGLRVQLSSGRAKNSGKLVIHYRSIDEFDRLAERLGVDLSE